jgi:hypothetical protein
VSRYLDVGSGLTAFHADVAVAMAGVGVDLRNYPPDTAIEEFIADVGEPAFAVLVLVLESHLPEPFPEQLLQEIATLDDLAWFAHIKLSHAP